MKHLLPWETTYPLNVVDADGVYVCTAKDEATAKEIVAVAALAHATLLEIRARGAEPPCPLGVVGPSARPTGGKSWCPVVKEQA